MDEMLKKYGDNVNNIHIVNEDDFVCGYDGITYSNYKMADNAKQVCKQFFQNNLLFIQSSKNK